MRTRALQAAALLFAAFPALAQQNIPHIGYVYPAGVRQGVEIEVTVGGQFIDGVNRAYVSGTGIEVEVLGIDKLMTQGQANRLRDEMREINEKRSAKPPTFTAADEKRLGEIRQQLSTFIRRPASIAIADQVRLKITAAANAALGERELRLLTPAGATNPLVFCVGQLPEVSKAPAKVSPDPESIVLASFRVPARVGVVEAPVKVPLPATINGQIAPGGVDTYTFAATKGQHLVMSVAARELIPYISDAVPGWFQASITLRTADGKEIASADHYRFHPDPVLHFEVPADGEYSLSIRDSIYRGREDFVYRITAGELPFVTGIFPLGAKAGTRASVEVTGWNLPASRVTENGARHSAGVTPFTVQRGETASNRLPFAWDTLPEASEKEPNNVPRNATRVKLPVIVNGRIERVGDVDVYRVDGRAGDEIVAEVTARRLDSPLDSILRITDAKGAQLAVNDDFEDKGAGLVTHQADSRLRVKLPANGAYYISVADTQRKAGPEYAYRLRISKPQPDFELRVTPSAINARPGSNVPLTVYALRRDGFDGEIALRLKDAPGGFALAGAWIPAGQQKVRVTLTVPADGFAPLKHIAVEGRATVQGKEVRRAAVPAEDMMQAFFYRHLVPSQDLLVRVMGNGRGAPFKLAADKPVRLASGGTATMRVNAPLGRLNGDVRLSLNEPPEGIAIQEVSRSGGTVAFTLTADAAKVKPGTKGNLIVDAFIERTTAANTKAKANRFRQPIGSLPAIPFEIVAP